MRLVFPLVFLLLGLAPGALARDDAPGGALDPKAKEFFDRGTVQYNLQDYVQAAKEYRAGYQIDPRPVFLWAIAQSQRLSGDCEAATKSYNAFLRSGPSATGTAAAQEQIAVCKVQLEKQRAAAAQTAVTAAPPLAVTAAPAPPVHTAWYGDTLGQVLFWSGLVALGAGGGLLVKGNSTASTVNAAGTYDAYAADRASAPLQQRLGVGLLAGGGALLAGGVTRFLLQAGAAPAAASSPSSKPARP